MVFFPLIFFLFLLYFIYKHNGVDMSFCMISIYAFSSLLSIFLYYDSKQNFTFNYSIIETSIVPTLLYCILVWLSVYPFYKFNSNKKRNLRVKVNEKLFSLVTYVYVAMFFVILILFYDQIGIRLVMSNMNNIRHEYYNGDFSITEGMSYSTQLVAYMAIFLAGCSYFMLILFFFSLSALRRSKSFNILLLISTTTSVISGILNMDRSSTVYYLMLVLLGYFLFKPYIRRENRKFLYGAGFIFLGFALVYFAAVTIARFGDSNSGTSGGLIDYAGQSYLNYCYIWDNLWYDQVYWGKIFPITNLLTGFVGSFKDFAMTMYQRTNIDVNVFFSSSGFFLVHIGHLAAVLAPLIIFFISMRVVKSNSSNTIGLKNFILIFAFAIIPQCGLITYFYTSVPRVLNLIVFLCLSRIIERKTKYANINRR